MKSNSYSFHTGFVCSSMNVGMFWGIWNLTWNTVIFWTWSRSDLVQLTLLAIIIMTSSHFKQIYATHRKNTHYKLKIIVNSDQQIYVAYVIRTLLSG